jgi:hypothetical protein
MYRQYCSRGVSARYAPLPDSGAGKPEVRMNKNFAHQFQEPLGTFFRDDSDEGFVARIQWLKRTDQFSDEFFTRMLKVRPEELTAWLTQKRVFPRQAREALREFWNLHEHILGLYDFDLAAVKHLYQFQAKPDSTGPTSAPWLGSSLKTYLEKQGIAGIKLASQWIQSLRYADQ